MAINFGGLATGFDTGALISALMQTERRPIERLQAEKNFQSSRLSAFSGFEQRLKTLLMRFENLDTADEVRAYKASATSDAYFSVMGSAEAVPGNFQVEVKNLAQVQKSVSQEGYASKTDASFGTGSITITPTTSDYTTASGSPIVIDYDGDSLTSLAEKINAASTGSGVSASIINDGTENGFRLVLTGKDSGLHFTVDDGGVPFVGLPTQSAQQATILVDNIEIKSKTNVFDQAIPGVTLTITKPHGGDAATGVKVEFDKGTLRSKVQGFVSAYNDVVNYISQQSDSSWGRDSSFRAVKGQLQSLLVKAVGGDGDNLRTLSQLGIKTDAKAGTITLDAARLDKAIDENLVGIETLFAGKEGVEGIAKQFTTFLKGMTNSVDGLYAGRKKSTESSLRQIDAGIDRNERRLEQREKTLRAQFDALETLVSSMNATSNFLNQQMTLMNNLWSRKR